MKNNIDNYGLYEKYVDDNTKQSFMKKLNETVDWIYGEGQSASKDLYKAKLDEYKKIGTPIRERYRFHSEIEVYMNQFQQFS
jgi:hypothetical protein